MKKIEQLDLADRYVRITVAEDMLSQVAFDEKEEPFRHKLLLQATTAIENLRAELEIEIEQIHE